MAKRLGIATATLNKYERGHRVPDAATLASMVDTLGCDAAWLLVGRSRFFTGEPLDSRYLPQGDVFVRDDSRSAEIDPAIREIVDWAGGDAGVRGVILLYKDREIRPFVEKHAPHLLADLKRNAG